MQHTTHFHDDKPVHLLFFSLHTHTHTFLFYCQLSLLFLVCNCGGNLIKGNLATVFYRLRLYAISFFFTMILFLSYFSSTQFYTSIIVDLLTASFLDSLIIIIIFFLHLRCWACLLFNLYILNTYTNSPSFIASSLQAWIAWYFLSELL